MQVTQLWQYPVKSMIGRRVDEVRVDELGVVGDRSWAARDVDKGGIRGAKKIAGLMQLTATDIADGHVEITFPDGSTVRTSDADRDERLSDALGVQVRLEQLRPASDTDHYRRGAPDSDDMLEELRGIFGRTDDEPLPDLSVFPPELMEFESPPGTYYDAFPLLVMTEQALETLTDSLPESVIDVRRFRPSIVVDAGAVATATSGHPEFGWAGRRARLGEAQIDFTVPCPRCVMVTREIDDEVGQDRAVLRHIVRELDQNVGVYASITQPGAIRVGDRLELL
ncbi:MAG: MOSC domain-containing protein [Acidimicrobiia bacterium]|nr:MOSC domain-containing protein [Acidimicrobiia bacterium]